MYYREDLVDLHRKLDLMPPAHHASAIQEVPDEVVREILSEQAPIPLLNYFAHRVEAAVKGKTLNVYERARLEVNRGDFREAWKLLEEAAGKGYPDALLYLGSKATSLSKGSGIPYFEKAYPKRAAIAKKGVGKILAREAVSSGELSQNHVRLAVSAYFLDAAKAAGAEHPPAYGESVYLIGKLASHTRDEQGKPPLGLIIQAAKEAAENGKHPPAYWLWSEYIFKWGKNSEGAIEILHRALELCSIAHVDLGNLHTRLGDLEKALEHWNEAVRLGWMKEEDLLKSSRVSFNSIDT